MYEMIMAYKRKKLLSVYTEVGPQDFTVLYLFILKTIFQKPLGPAWLGLDQSARVQALVAAAAKQTVFHEALLKIRLMYVKSHCH